MTNYLLAGGGTAGHVNPLLSLADEISNREPDARVFVLGTREGLEARLVPDHGYELLTIERLPFPRKINAYALSFPLKFAAAVRGVQQILKSKRIDVVVGFGGYVSAPAYVAANRTKVPLVIHEANALPGIANRRAAKTADAVGVAFASTKLPNAEHVGMPLRKEIEQLLRHRDQKSARQHFGLDPETTTLLVTGGSLGAKRINDTIEASRKALSAAGIQVIHIVGDRSDLAPVNDADFVRMHYCDRMDLAIAASDLAISRSGASTVSEFTAIGLPAIYVPYPVGNGEQKFNVADIASVGGAKLVADEDFDRAYVMNEVIPLASSTRMLAEMSQLAKANSISDGTSRLYELVRGVLSNRVA